MLKAIEDISTTKKRLKIEIPSDAIEAKIKEFLIRVRQKAKMPGFRPGKTPMSIIEKYYGKNAEAEAIEKLIPEFYEKALKEAEITPVTQPTLESVVDFQKNNPLSLAFTVEIIPSIENLNYSNIKLKDIPLTVSDDEVDTSLERIQDRKATFEISEKEIEIDDLVTVDYEIKYDDQTTSAKDQALQIGSSILPKEISESLIGKKVGDTVEVEAFFPENFHVRALAGKKAIVKNTVKAVKKKILPAIDDELAKDMGFETLDALKIGLKEEIERAKKNDVQRIQKDAILEKLVNTHEFDVPESLIEKELSAMVTEAKRKGKSDKSDEDLRSELRQEAIKTAKATVLLSVIGKKEGVSVTDEELKENILEISQRLSIPPESLMRIYIQRDGSLEGLRNNIYAQKVLDILLSKANIEKGEE